MGIVKRHKWRHVYVRWGILNNIRPNIKRCWFWWNLSVNILNFVLHTKYIIITISQAKSSDFILLPYHKLNIVHEYETFICISYFTILKCLVGINIQKFVHKKMYAITHAETYYKKVQERGNAKHISTIFTL